MKLKPIYEQIITEQIGFYTIIPFIEDKLGIKVGEFIGYGQSSDVFSLGSDKVLKITTSKSDVEGFLVGKKHPEYPIPKVYAIYKIDPKTKRKEITRFRRDIWVIIAEKASVGGFYSQDEDKLRDWFTQNTPYEANDVHGKNIGKDSTGRLVYIDPSFTSTNENADSVEILKL